MTSYPAGGVLFPNDKKNADKQPDYYGNVEIDRELLAEINDQLRANEKAKLRLAGWKRQNDKGSYLSLKPSAPYDPEKGSPRPQRQEASPQEERKSIDDDLDQIPF